MTETMNQGLAQRIARELNIRTQQVDAAVKLIDEANTLPFIARYRKEMTGSLTDEQLRDLAALLEKYRAMDARRETVLASIEEQGKLTDELRERINAATTMTELEDLYQPYRPKRRTRASIARDRGLQPLADLILEQAHTRETVEKLAATYLNEEVPDVEAALAGARDIVAEAISDDPDVRGNVRQKALKWGLQRSALVKDAQDEKGVYRLYYEFEMRVDRLRPHQILAINRGEAEKVLRVTIDVADRDWRDIVERAYRIDRRSPFANQLQAAIEDASSRLLLPAIERDVRRELGEHAEKHAINVFSSNLRGLLNQPPLAGHVILGIDPGFRTGCKVAVIDATGKVLDTSTIYPHPPQNQYNAALNTLNDLINKHGVTLISIGNGTASRETERLTADLTRGRDDVHYLIVSEGGASVYSASKLASDELPELDVTLRGAVSIARRVQDPLAELVKIDPKSIGVGMYQHDVNQSELANALEGVVESVVNSVGVDLNTASPALLTHVAGIGAKLAESIVSHRDSNGQFNDRASLKNVKGLGAKSFEQCAGFLRVRDGSNPLDASAIHPESYTIAKKVLKHAGISADSSLDQRESAILPLKSQVEQLAETLSVGIPTLTDILEQLVRPGRDPREDVPAPILRSDVLSMEDLTVGMRLQGTARNVVDFGVFVDIGVKQDGLLHRSQMRRNDNIGVGDIIDVEILSIDEERGRIGLGLVSE